MKRALRQRWADADRQCFQEVLEVTARLREAKLGLRRSLGHADGTKEPVLKRPAAARC